MTEMTMGERIAMERKKLGLSQEGLGEKAGVSRQSISKWESGSAMPEIEKLIALSKLFGVSVGWLLGVEDQPEQQENELSDVQLKVVDQLVRQAAPHTRRHTVAAVGLTAAVLLVSFVMAKQTHDTAIQVKVAENQITALSAQLEDINDRLAVMESMESAVLESAVLNPGDSVLAEYSLDVTPMDYDTQAQENVALVSFRAFPKVWNSGDTGYLNIRRGTEPQIRVDCIWDGTQLRAAKALGVHLTKDNYEICFVVERYNGVQEQQVLKSRLIEALPQSFTIPMVVDMGTLEYEDNTLVLKDFTAHFDMPPVYEEEENVPSVVVCEYLLQARPKDDSTYVNFTADMLEQSRLDPEGDYSYVVSGTDIRFEGIELDRYDHLHLKFHVILSNGMERKLGITTLVPEGGDSFL